MKHLLVLSLLLFASSSSVLAADADACRQLLVSSLPDEGGADAQAYFDDAEKVFRDCRGTALPVDIRVKALMKYGTSRAVRGSTQAAIEAFREALDILDSTSGDQTQMLIAVLDSLRMAETDAHLRLDSIAHAKRALSLRQVKFGDDSVEAVQGMVSLGFVHASFGDWGKCESLLRAAVRIAEKACGPECDALAEAYSGMAAFYASQGNVTEEKKYDELAINAIPPRKRASQDKD